MDTGSGVYAILNELNGKIYIGSTVNFSKRWYEHKRTSSNCIGIKNAIRKYGENNFSFHVLEYVDIENYSRLGARKKLVSHEQKWIELVSPFKDKGYNVLSKAGSHLGAKRSEETKRKLSKAFKGIKHPEWRVEKNRIAHIGKVTSEGTKQKLREAFLGRISPMKGRKQSEEAKAKIRKWSLENRDKLSRVFSEEHRKKLSAALMGRKGPNKGKPMSEETKQKLRLAKLGRPSPRKGVTLSEETKEKIRKSLTGYKHNDEFREKMRQSALIQWANFKKENTP